MAARPVSIRAVLNGFVVEVGCQTLVVEGGADKLGQLIGAYYSPELNERMEREYLERGVNSKLLGADGILTPTENRSGGDIASVQQGGGAARPPDTYYNTSRLR